MHLNLSHRSRAALGFFFFLSCIASAQSVSFIDERGIDSLISQRNNKILLLNIWATWCDPCREEFPDLISLADAYRSRGVEVVAISVDYPDEVESKILPFLDTMNVPFPVFVSNIEQQDNFFAQFDKSWSGAIPATFIYDPRGLQKKFLLGKQSMQQLKKAVEDITGKP